MVFTSLVSQCIVGLHNDALSHFLNGEYDQAIDELRIAYDVFRRHSEQNNGISLPADSCLRNSKRTHLGQGPSVIEKTYSRTAQHCSTVEEQGMLLDNISKPRDNHKAGAWGNFYFSQSSLPGAAYSMYNRALMLSPDELNGTDAVEEILDPRYQHRTCAILLYNMALVYHNVGIHLGVSSSLWDALRLYESALVIIGTGTPQFPYSEKMLLAIWNNMGNIHAHFFHTDNTTVCMNNLRRVLASAGSLLLMDEDYLFFFLNALFQGKELCFAPAA
eukprot:Nitzschia sp. Nitz4//scaffold185_size43419//8532//9356//NITZ4_007295-RA/size43419-processed-gene-0.11-mRNA-1//1//CDS//3329539691//4904//frame0